MATQVTAAGRTGAGFATRTLRRNQNPLLAAALGGLVALLMLALPMEAALASAVVVAFVLLMLVDTRVAVLALLAVRASLDITAKVPLIASGESSAVNAAAITSLLVVGVGFAHLALYRVNIWRIPLVKPFAIFLAIAALSVPLAPEPARALQDWLRFTGGFLIYILVVELIRTHSDLRWVLRILLMSAIFPLIVGLYQYITETGNQQTVGLNRIMGTFTHPSPYASYLVQLVPLAIVFFLPTNSRLSRVGLGIMVPVMVFSIYATQTRVAWIGLIVVGMVFMWTRARWSLLLVPLLAGAMFFGLSDVRARFDEASSSTGSVFWRQQQWARAIDVASPPQLITIGAGLGAVDVTLGNFAHNEYVRLLVETGALGLLATIILYKQLFQVTLNGYRTAKTPWERDLMLAMIMALSSRVVIAASDNLIAFPVLEWYFWSFAGVIVVMSGAYREVEGYDTETALQAEDRRAAA